MHKLDENQFKELSYHISSINCVCNENKQFNTNFNKVQFGSSNQSTSSVNSSPASSQYSSPINSPPLSPTSSISSYSSAEEDFQEDFQDYFVNQNTFKFDLESNDNLNNSNQSLADLLTVDFKNQDNNVIDNDLNVINCDQFEREFDDFKTQNYDKNFVDQQYDDKQFKNETNLNKFNNDLNETSINKLNESINQLNKINQQKRIRKTSILRNRKTSNDLLDYQTDCNNKKEVKFADSLGLQLERIKYYSCSPQSYNYDLSNLYCDYLDDYLDEHKNLFILNKTATKSRLLRNQQQQQSNNKQNLNNQTCSTNDFWSNCKSNYYQPFSYTSNYLPFSPIKDQYCDMFHNQKLNFNDNNLNQKNFHYINHTQLNTFNNQSTLNNVKKNLIHNYTQISRPIKFNNNFDFMNNNQKSTNSNQLSILPINFSTNIPNRLNLEFVLLHSIDTIGNFLNGIVSVKNLTFEKKIIIKYTLDKWLTERECLAKYFKKDNYDDSDQFIFQIELKQTDFPLHHINEDHYLLFAIRYETGDGNIFWNNNYGQDFRLKCKFN